jgi:glycerol-3-phosphate dehydrogenase
VGGKLTTYRRMAQDAVDAAVAASLGDGVRLPGWKDALRRLPGRKDALRPGPCRTRRLPLVGAAGPRALAAVPAPARLVARYGTEAPAVLRLAEHQPELAAPVAPGIRTTGAELAFAVAHEGALDTGDLLDRRTRIGLVAADRQQALPAAARALEVQGRT